jgi:tetratricopeptide (TPR) repeat protein
MKNYAKSAEQYEKYIGLVEGEEYGKLASSGDYYKLGIAWNKAAQALRNDTTQEGKALQKSYLIKTDTIFGVVCKLSPESHIGFLYRGNVNFEMDPEAEAGIAKPHYEKALSIMNDRIAEGKATVESLKSAFSTIYSYMAFHYFKRDDKENVLSYSNKILEIDPKNKLAKSLIAVYEQEAAEVKK